MTATSAKRQPNRWPALLDAAAAQFAERGYHATSMRDLAAATAMTAGAIYFHVPSKQALLLAVYEEGVQRLLDRVEAAAAAMHGQDHSVELVLPPLATIYLRHDG